MPKTKFITNEKLPLGFGYSIRYNHNQGSPNFGRVDKGQVMLLSNHDSSVEKVLGTVKNAYHDAASSFADIDLLELEDDPAIKRASALLNNKMQGISAGILVHEAHVEGRTLEVDKWELVELSITPVPRDSGTTIDMGFIANEGGANGLIAEYFNNAGDPAPTNPPANPPADPPADPPIDPPIQTNSEDDMATLEEVAELLKSNNASLAEGIGAQVAEALKKNAEEPPPGDPVIMEPEDEPEDTDPNRVEGHPVGCKCDECEASRNTASLPPVDHPTVIKSMVDIAVNQSRFNKETVLELHRQSVAEGMKKDDFVTKLETIAIHPSPFAPNSSEPAKGYDLGLALTEMMRGRIKDSSYEHALSDDILNKSEMPIYNPNTLAIPWNVILNNTKYGGTAGTDSVGTAVLEELLPIIRKDVPDPLNIVPLFTRLPSTPGESNVVYIDVPTPTMVEEPGDTGYVKTGDSFTEKVPMTPKLQVDRVLITRLSGVTVPTLLASILNIGLQMMNEQMNRLSLVGRGSANFEVDGLYSGSRVTAESAEMTQLSDITAKIVTDSLDQSFQIANADKLIIVSPEVRTNMRTIARPTAVGAFFVNGAIDEAPVTPTDYLKIYNAGGMVTGGQYRGLVGPMADCFLKQWDDAVFVHTRYEDGNQIMVLETFWDLLPTHPELWYKIKDDA